MRSIKRVTNKAIFTALFLALVLAVLSVVMSFAFTRAARAEDTEEYTPTSLGISNPDFSDTSGSTPASPSNWTGAAVGEGTSADIVTGVVDLSPSAYRGENSGNEKLKLDQYPEFDSEDKFPTTIFGANSEYSGSDSKALFINTAKGAEGGYAYSSSDMTFDKNAFYRVSAWVKTGDFASDTGATIKLTGLDKPISFININTVADLEKANGAPVFTKENRYGWVKYTMYVRTSSSVTSTVKLVLGLGDAVTSEDETPSVTPRLASGYAFFDTVKAERISASDFAFDTEDFVYAGDNTYVDAAGTTKLLDLYELDYMTNGDEEDPVEIGTFSDSNGNSLWNMNAVYDPDAEDESYVGPSNAYIYNSYIDADIENKENGFTKNPWAPLGRAEDKSVYNNDLFTGTNGNILVISTYNSSKKTFESSARGVASPDFKIKRFGYYRLGVWIKGDSVDGGAGISIGVKGETVNSSTDNKLAQWYTGLTADGDAATYGWTEHAVYIKGSNMSDLNVHFELWLGSPSSKSAGIAMFDNVTFTELKYSEYSKLSEGAANILNLDADQTATGVTNGNFATIGDIDDDKIEFPLPAADWSLFTTNSINIPGFSKNEVSIDDAVHGIIPSGEFDSVAGKISAQDPATFANAPLYNVLVISSPTKTAFCYRSAELNVNVDKSYKLEVEMAVSGVSADSYGASLVLRGNGSQVLSSIENITTTNNAFKTYTFYIDAPLAEDIVKVEIWLGLNDRNNNTEKLSDGVIYVKSVSYNEWTASSSDSDVTTEYKEIFNKYLEDISTPAYKSIDYGVYSFKQPSLDYFDFYSYNSGKGFAAPYAFSVATDIPENAIYGIFNSERMLAGQLEGFDKKDQSGNMFLIYNTLPNYTTATYSHSLALVSNMYYRLDVTLKVRVSEEVRNNADKIGAGIKITGTKTVSFDNIKDTTTLVAEGREDSRDTETFKTYTFYIATGSNGGSVGLIFSFGGDSPSSYIEGQLIVSDISFFEINNTVYENAVANPTAYTKTVSLSDTTQEDNSNAEVVSGGINAWVVPSIIFGAALIIAIIIIVVVRLRDRAKKKQKTEYTSEYDRSSVTKEIDRLKAAEKDADKKSDAADDLDDEMEADEELADEAKAETEPSDEDDASEAAEEESTETADEATAETAETDEADKASDTAAEEAQAPASDDLDD